MFRLLFTLALFFVFLATEGQIFQSSKPKPSKVDFDSTTVVSNSNPLTQDFITRYNSVKDSLGDTRYHHKIERAINTGKLAVDRKKFWKSVGYGFRLRRLYIESNIVLPAKNPDYVNRVVNTVSGLHEQLQKIEAPTEFEVDISSSTRAAISSIDRPYDLAIFRRQLLEDVRAEHSDFMIDKVREAMGYQMSILSRKYYPAYSYPSDHKDAIKFISIRTGNDLFTISGLSSLSPSYKPLPDGRWLFQRNDDRDYTGSFLLEFGTDYLNLLKRTPVNSYQVFLMGFDVYTPYFRSDSLFSQPDSYNTKDRPHASFQYMGWSRHTLADVGHRRSSITVKGGKIGGDAGAKFQTSLHQDISSSPRPYGWDAQIANGGRIGFSLELQIERQWKLGRENPDRHPYSLANVYLSGSAEAKFGTYMTNAGLGVMLTNKPFTQTNSNFLGVYKWTNRRVTFLHHFMYSVSFTGYYSVHNTMLEGYGWIKTIEDPTDSLARNSIYKLDRSQVKPVYFVGKYVLSYSTKYFTIFYNWMTISPETWFSKIGIYSPYGLAHGKKVEMDISHRWHNIAVIGLAFRIAK